MRPHGLRQVVAVSAKPLGFDAHGCGLADRAGIALSMLTLFRVLELDGGSISIDGQDIAHLGLSQLRKAIAMLPQDPVRVHTLSSNGSDL